MLLRITWCSYTSTCEWLQLDHDISTLLCIFQVLTFSQSNVKSWAIHWHLSVTLNKCSWQWKMRSFAMPAACGENTQNWLQPNLLAECQQRKEMRSSQDLSFLHTFGSLQYLYRGQTYLVFCLIIQNQCKDSCMAIRFGWEMGRMTTLIYP